MKGAKKPTTSQHHGIGELKVYDREACRACLWLNWESRQLDHPLQIKTQWLRTIKNESSNFAVANYRLETRLARLVCIHCQHLVITRNQRHFRPRYEGRDAVPHR